MEAFFDCSGSAGRAMMRSTAALQVNLDLGRGDEVQRRWRAAHEVGPVLAAAFANSPIGDTGPTGHRSTRLAIWSAIDGGRTARTRRSTSTVATRGPTTRSPPT